MDLTYLRTSPSARWQALTAAADVHFAECPACTGHDHCDVLGGLEEQAGEAGEDIDDRWRARWYAANN